MGVQRAGFYSRDIILWGSFYSILEVDGVLSCFICDLRLTLDNNYIQYFPHCFSRDGGERVKKKKLLADNSLQLLSSSQTWAADFTLTVLWLNFQLFNTLCASVCSLPLHAACCRCAEWGGVEENKSLKQTTVTAAMVEVDEASRAPDQATINKSF